MKSRCLNKILPLWFFIFTMGFISAQTIDDDIYKYSKISLPSLTLLFENASNAASVEYYRSLKEYEEKTLSAEKRNWLKYIQIAGLYRYGVNSVQLMEGSGEIVAPTPDKSPQDWYNVGASLAIPLDDLFDRGGKVKRQKIKIQAADNQLEAAYDQVKIEIINIYTQLQKEIDILKMQLEQLTLIKTNYEQSKLDFAQNNISIQEFTNQKELYNGELTKCFSSKYTIENLILKLEIISQTKIISK